VTEDRHRPITINHDGFRYPVNLPPQAKNEIRIYSFGDSVTMGWGVDDDSTYSAVLERLLNSDPPQPIQFRVVSAGVNAYPNALALERLERVLEDPSQVNIVILAYSFNTEFGRLAELQGKEKKQFLGRVALKGIIRRSAIYNFVIEDLLRNLVYYRLRARLAEGSWSSHNESPGSGVARYRRALWEMKIHADSREVRPILLLLGSEGQKSILNDYQQTMLEFARESQLPFVNMVDVFRGEDHSRIFLDHVHPNEYGHQVIAQQLARVVRTVTEEIVRGRSGASPGATPNHNTREQTLER
jgi:lysophospholipase L1-like esterase